MRGLLPTLLRALSTLVPRERRAAWRKEWEAELIHLDRRMAQSGQGRWVRDARRLLHTIDALEDAVGMWRRNRVSLRAGQHLRVALRSLGRSPGFALVAIATLSLGIGANTAVFSVVRGVLLRPLPYHEPDSLVDVVLSFRGSDPAHDFVIPASEPEFLEVSAEDTGLASLAGYWTTSANLGGGVEPIRVPVAYVSANFLEVLGVAPRLGRGFTTGEDRPGRTDVMVLSHGLWTRAFGADPSAVGGDAVLNGRPVRIVGVLPPSFVFPGPSADALLPNSLDPVSPAGRSSHYIDMLGRLGPGLTVSAVQGRIDALTERWSEAFPDRHGVNRNHPLRLVPLQESLVGDARATLLVLMGAAGLVLLIACANLASLMLLRSEHRQHERGVRVALGGRRSHVAAPLLAESLLVALVGGLAGLALASASLGTIERMGPALLEQVGGIGIDATVLWFTLGATIATTLGFGMFPALVTSGGDLTRELRGRSAGGPARMGVRRGLVVTEIALSVMLVVASGLLVRSFVHLQTVPPGFDPDGVVTLEFSLSSGAYPEAPDVAAFHDALSVRLTAAPGISAFGSVRALPFADPVGLETLTPTDRPADPENLWNASYQVVGPGFAEAIGIPVLAGRHLSRADGADAPGAVVVNEAMAKAFWPGEDPLGATFKLGGPATPNPDLTVVGVVGDILQAGYDGAASPQFFLPLAQAGAIYGGLGTRRQSLVIRSELAPAETLERVREAIRAVDPGLPVARAASLSGIMDQSVRSERFLTVLVGTFSLLALVLGAVGIGGLVAYSVARRTRELGLRMVLGADARALVRRVLGGAVALTATGIGLGLAGAWWSARLLADELFEVAVRDPAAFVTGPAVLFVVSVLAAYVPARRATRVDPVRAMRAE